MATLEKTKRQIGFQDRLSLNAGLKWNILQYVRPSLSYEFSLRHLSCLFLSGRFTQVLKIIGINTYLDWVLSYTLYIYSFLQIMKQVRYAQVSYWVHTRSWNHNSSNAICGSARSYNTVALWLICTQLATLLYSTRKQDTIYKTEQQITMWLIEI